MQEYQWYTLNILKYYSSYRSDFMLCAENTVVTYYLNVFLKELSNTYMFLHDFTGEILWQLLFTAVEYSWSENFRVTNSLNVAVVLIDCSLIKPWKLSFGLGDSSDPSFPVLDSLPLTMKREREGKHDGGSNQLIYCRSFAPLPVWCSGERERREGGGRNERNKC